MDLEPFYRKNALTFFKNHVLMRFKVVLLLFWCGTIDFLRSLLKIDVFLSIFGGISFFDPPNRRDS